MKTFHNDQLSSWSTPKSLGFFLHSLTRLSFYPWNITSNTCSTASFCVIVAFMGFFFSTIDAWEEIYMHENADEIQNFSIKIKPCAFVSLAAFFQHINRLLFFSNCSCFRLILKNCWLFLGFLSFGTQNSSFLRIYWFLTNEYTWHAKRNFERSSTMITAAFLSNWDIWFHYIYTCTNPHCWYKKKWAPKGWFHS